MAKQRTRTGSLVAAIAATAVLALAASAGAKGVTTVSGETATGAAVKLSLGEFNNPTAFQIAGYEVECRNGTLVTNKATYKRFDRSDPGAFKARTKDKGREGNLRFRSQTAIQGTDDGAGNWVGTFKRVTKVLKRGKKLDTCRVETSWSAS